MTHNTKKAPLAVLAAALALAAPAVFTAPANAGILHRHPIAASLAAGMAAHHMAKHAHGGMMHRHPMMTGVAAGMAAHHMLKHH